MDDSRQLRGCVRLNAATIEDIRKAIDEASCSITTRWLSIAFGSIGTFAAGVHASKGNWGWVALFGFAVAIQCLFFIFNERKPPRSRLGVELADVELRVGRG